MTVAHGEDRDARAWLGNSDIARAVNLEVRHEQARLQAGMVSWGLQQDWSCHVWSCGQRLSAASVDGGVGGRCLLRRLLPAEKQAALGGAEGMEVAHPPTGGSSHPPPSAVTAKPKGRRSWSPSVSTAQQNWESRSAQAMLSRSSVPLG